MQQAPLHAEKFSLRKIFPVAVALVPTACPLKARAQQFAPAGNLLYNAERMKIGVIGTGYVGLVTGVCFAELGNDVVCVDVDEAKVKAVQAGQIPIYEPGLEKLCKKALKARKLHATTDLAQAAKHAEILFLALPTPPGEDGSADLSYVLDVAEKLGPLLEHYTVVVNKSTVPVGTARRVREAIARNADIAAFDVVSNPEFLREGFAVHDFLQPDRIVIGTSSERASQLMQQLYEPMTGRGCPLLMMDEPSAELTKYAANSFLAMKITFMNQVANLCEAVGADVDAVRLGVGSDDRIGPRFLYPGIGYGGSCFPKDVQALLHVARAAGCNFELLETIITLNRQQQRRLTEKVMAMFGNDLTGRTFALWGLAFKPNTDDIRQSPALRIIEDLTAAGAHIIAYDPQAIANTKRQLGENPAISYGADMYDAAEDADALLVATEWPQFEGVDLARVKAALKQPVLFDGRNIFSPAAMRAAGFTYVSIGRAASPSDDSLEDEAGASGR